MCAPYHYRLDWHLSWRFFAGKNWGANAKLDSELAGHFRSFLVLVASQLFGRGNKHGTRLALSCFFFLNPESNPELACRLFEIFKHT